MGINIQFLKYLIPRRISEIFDNHSRTNLDIPHISSDRLNEKGTIAFTSFNLCFFFSFESLAWDSLNCFQSMRMTYTLVWMRFDYYVNTLVACIILGLASCIKQRQIHTISFKFSSIFFYFISLLELEPTKEK